MMDAAIMMTENEMKTVKKKCKVSPYQKALERMERETHRAVAHVELLSKLYAEAVKKNIQVKT